MSKKGKSSLKQKLQIVAMTLIQFAFFGRQFVYFSEIKPILFWLIITTVAVLAIITFYQQKPTTKTLFLYAFCTLVGISSYIMIDDPALLYVALVGVIAIGSNLRKITKIDLMTKIITFSLIILLFVTGNTTAVTELRSDGLLRQSLGFHHPNALGYMLTMIYADTLILLDNKKTPFIKISIWGIFIAIILAADSRTSAIIITALLLFELFKSKITFARKQERILACFVPLLLLVFTFVATILYENGTELAEQLNQTFNHRIELQAIYHANYDLSFTGQGLIYATGRTLDNGYFHMLYQFGILGEAVILLLYTTSIKQAIANRSKNMIAPHILILLSIYALMETNPVRIMITPLALYSLTKEDNQANKERNSHETQQ